jgi:hypothetical protein
MSYAAKCWGASVAWNRRVGPQLLLSECEEESEWTRKHHEWQVIILIARGLLDWRGNNGVTFHVRRASKLAAILWA